MQALENGEEGVGSFQVVSAILEEPRKAAVGGRRAHLRPRAADAGFEGRRRRAARTSRRATLLWDSLSQPHVGRVGRDSRLLRSRGEGLQRQGHRQGRHRLHALQPHARISSRTTRAATCATSSTTCSARAISKIEVLDRIAGLGIKPDDMAGILQTGDRQAVELMFDHKSGWAADPQREAAVEGESDPAAGRNAASSRRVVRRSRRTRSTSPTISTSSRTARISGATPSR